jgi:anti-anti-sigma regulatory factor
MSMFGGKRPRPDKDSSAKAADSSAGHASPGLRAGKGDSKPDDTSKLDFKALSDFANPRDERRAQKTAKETSEPRAKAGADPSTTLNLEVLSAAAGQAPIVEEAAILYANGQAGEAKARLLRAIEFEALGSSVERVWRMLLDLHQELGEQAAFDARALDFAVMFERSAPAWRECSQGRDPLSQTSGGSVGSLTGRLSAASAPQVTRLRELAGKSGLLRVDFSKLKGADAEGCKLLLSLLQSIRQRGGDAMFSGESVLLDALTAGTPSGDRRVDPALWLLRLEILQWQGRQSDFEDVALAYAVTYEVSPPSYEPRPRRTVAASGTGASQTIEGVVRAPSEISGQADAFFRKIIDAANERASVQVDCSELKRMDFVSAGNLLNIATRMKSDGKQLELRQVNTLVAALLEVMGVAEFASLSLRR